MTCAELTVAVKALSAACVGLFGWLMKAKADHYQDLRNALEEANKRASS